MEEDGDQDVKKGKGKKGARAAPMGVGSKRITGGEDGELSGAGNAVDPRRQLDSYLDISRVHSLIRGWSSALGAQERVGDDDDCAGEVNELLEG